MKRFIIPDIIFYFSLLAIGVVGFVLAIIWPHGIGFSLATILASVSGLGVTIYIWYSKRFQDHLACPTGSNCNDVVNSKYAHFLGIPLEYMGMAYYALIFFSYVAFIIKPEIRTTLLLPTILIMTAGAFIFSIYLTSIQAFILKKWCIWCLLSAALSIGIFVAALKSIPFAGGFLLSIYNVLLLSESLGFVLGMGGATSALFIFFKFLDDSHVDDNEANAFKSLSEMIWVGLGLVFISKYAMYIALPQQFGASNLFTIQLIALSIIFITGAILNVLFAPLLTVMPFEESSTKDSLMPLKKLRKGAFVVGSMGLLSWYFVFVTRFISEYSLPPLTLAYLLTLAASIAIGFLIDVHFRNK